jgi:hypothetical protein
LGDGRAEIVGKFVFVKKHETLWIFCNKLSNLSYSSHLQVIFRVGGMKISSPSLVVDAKTTKELVHSSQSQTP